MAVYIHQLKSWPQFTWDKEKIAGHIAEIIHLQGRFVGKMESLGFTFQSEAELATMTLEILKSNEIEGEILDPEQVRSSIARGLGMEIAGLVPSDRYVDGVVEIMLNATQKFNEKLTEKRLFEWHKALFPEESYSSRRLNAGVYRKRSGIPMQVVSGPIGKEKVHFEAPADNLVHDEMHKFLSWFNSDNDLHPLLKAAFAHLWFVTIHPFEDGNGRLARTIADMQLTRADGIPQRFYSMSAQIRSERKSYYDILERTQKGSMDITLWLEWFLNCLKKSIEAAESVLSKVMYKSRYWEMLHSKKLNDRQKNMINKLLDNFEGKLTSAKWAKITKTSHDTALRDIQNLIDQQVLVKEEAGGRSTSYVLTTLELKGKKSVQKFI